MKTHILVLYFLVKIANFDMMMIEKWPLVQAFAVENYGRYL